MIEVLAQVAEEEIAAIAAKAADEEVRCEPPSFFLGSECGEEEEEEEETMDQVAAKVFSLVYEAVKVGLLQAKLKEAVQEQHDAVEDALESAPILTWEETIAYFKRQRQDRWTVPPSTVFCGLICKFGTGTAASTVDLDLV